ncbi:hypothetical protein MUK70_03730 [Dyadobacter chenwenxiniae]|uniref:Uncharacterized protein n=1 Tax=Dyadobacter chenwenxiniae TaxID=2906456 RepID=A0A9X1TIV6_9BACT|nr:hypothetical protein [Dyadobacter chenwenxiniae]MCF0065859.1 hypothetical protein [Dyadobacter chenwenxiniae]UON84101.1 hypothetical protein MUK70_03730 [Dyadobacter chenwenxiniae]
MSRTSYLLFGQKGRGYGYNNVELAIDKLEKHVFNYTREIDFFNYNPYEITPYTLEKDLCD